MRLWKKIVAGALALSVGLPLLFAGVTYASAWYYRWRVGHLISMLKTVTPGVTTQADYVRMVHPFDAACSFIQIDGKPLPGAIAIDNRSECIERAFGAPAGELDNVLSGRLIPPGIMFSVIPKYEDGVVSELYVEYVAAVTGRSPGAFVKWSASRYGEDGEEPPGHFKGYRLSEMGLENKPPWEFFVTIDERATPDELSRGLDFRLQCFTSLSWCMDAHEFLQPAPDRPRP
jgi:hypothetical protein